MLTPLEIDNLVNLLENVAGELVGHLLERLGRRVGGARRDRLREREAAQAISAKVARAALDAGLREHPGFAERDWDIAFERLRAAVRAAQAEGGEPVAAAALSPERLSILLAQDGAEPNDSLPAGSNAQRAYEWLVAAVSPLIIREFEQRPDFDTQLARETLRQVVRIREALDVLLRGLDERTALVAPPELTAPRAGFAAEDAAARDAAVRDAAARETAARNLEARHARFESRYLAFAARSLGRFELFGVNRGREPSKQSFERSYVGLTMARSSDPDQSPQNDEGDDELTGAGVAVSNALSGRRRVIIRGSAGSGKTTLLSWLAANGAAGRLTGESGPWGRVVPFLVRLRDFANLPLPRVEELPAITAPAVDGERPEGWASGCFVDGRALLLVDGVDELPPERRGEVREWIEQLTEAYPEARYVVTVRPFAVPTRWLKGHAFDHFDLLPLSAKGIRDFLFCWHEAAKQDQDEARRRWLEQCRAGLDELMRSTGRPELRRLATSPLLCGLLCALYQDRDMELPRDRKSLLSAALELLLFRWNEQHGFSAEGENVPSREEQTILLQRFAYSMVKNQELVVDREQAAQRFSHALRGMRSHREDPQRVLGYVLERTGLFQEPRAGQVQFVHRTFRDYLAAKEVVEAGDLGFLLEQAHLDQWHEVVIMAMAHARPKERAQLLRRLLHGNSAAQHDRRIGDRLHLLAAASLEQADVLDGDEIRTTVQRAAARLIPPSSFEEAALLARAGDFVLDLLPGPEGLDERTTAYVVRTIATVGGTGSVEKIREFSAVDKTMVVDELLRAWRESDDPEGYARTVLARIEFGDREVKVQGWHKVLLLRHLSGLRNLHVPGDLTPLTPVAEIPNLQKLSLFQNYALRELTPLRRAAGLRTLQLSGCTFLTDLSPLRESGVTELHLFHMEKADLATLAGAPVTSLVIRDDRLVRGLDAIPRSLRLTRLVVDNLADRRNLRGIGAWSTLTQVECHGVPDEDELRELRELRWASLRELTVHASPDPRRRTEIEAALDGIRVSWT